MKRDPSPDPRSSKTAERLDFTTSSSLSPSLFRSSPENYPLDVANIRRETPNLQIITDVIADQRYYLILPPAGTHEWEQLKLHCLAVSWYNLAMQRCRPQLAEDAAPMQEPPTSESTTLLGCSLSPGNPATIPVPRTPSRSRCRCGSGRRALGESMAPTHCLIFLQDCLPSASGCWVEDRYSIRIAMPPAARRNLCQ